MIVIYLLISLILDGIISNLLLSNSLFIPLFSVVSLIISYPYFNDNKIKYLIYAGSLGILYDLSYTSIPFVNLFSFLLTALIIILICKFITINKLNLILILCFVILFYNSITYTILCAFRYNAFNNMILIEGLYSSLIINIVYGYISYIVLEIISKKHNYKRII